MSDEYKDQVKKVREENNWLAVHGSDDFDTTGLETGELPRQSRHGDNVFDNDLGVWVEGPMAALEVAASALNEFADEARFGEIMGLLEHLTDIYDPDTSQGRKNEAYAAYKRDCRMIGAEE